MSVKTNLKAGPCVEWKLVNNTWQCAKMETPKPGDPIVMG